MIQTHSSADIAQNPVLAAVLPCPFCGHAGKVTHKHFKKNYQGIRTALHGYMSMEARTIWFVSCSNSYCEVSPTTRYSEDKEEAISRWNVRNGG